MYVERLNAMATYSVSVIALMLLLNNYTETLNKFYLILSETDRAEEARWMRETE